MSDNIIISEECFKKEIIPLIKEGCTVPFKISGGSMEPFLAGNRDSVYITAPVLPLKKGDIAFFERESGKIVMHRVCKVDKNVYYFIGDAQTIFEGPISDAAIIGVVNSVNRKGKTINKGFTWYFFKHIWLAIVPLRPICFKIYNIFFQKNKT